MSKILITGGAGFIGSNLAKELNEGNEIIVVDDLSMGAVANIATLSNVRFIEENILNKEFMDDLLVKENFDYIYHLAAVASVADSIERPIETHEVNFTATLNILECLRQMENRNLKRLVFASSAAVYGDEETLPKEEFSVIKPLTPYAIDKFASEKFVLAYNNLYGVPTSAVRFFNVFGPNQNPASPYSGVISIVVDRFERKIKGESSTFTLFGDGMQSRDFIYVKDVVNALQTVANSENSLGEVFNVGNGKETTLNDLISGVSSILETEVEIIKEAEREGDIKRSVANVERLLGLGFKSKYTVNEGLREYLVSLNLI
ncbi:MULTISPECIES: NAD-dependent epimerase/dehydratase family protein [Vagococcus]|uniref:NAD-dependent epimerase/dehydratase family protein n=1 Tax=Vagococcus TaxID=2737 RepID=UPI002FC69735